MIEHKKNCLIINGKQSVKLKSGSISLKNYFKQLPVPFKIYADFEFLLDAIPLNAIPVGGVRKVSFLTKFFLLIIDLGRQLFSTEEKMQSISSVKQFLKDMIIVKK